MATDSTPSPDPAKEANAHLEALNRLVRALQENAPEDDELLTEMATRFGVQARADDVDLAAALDLLIHAQAAGGIGPRGDTLAAVAAGWYREPPGGSIATARQDRPLAGHVARLTALHHISQAATTSLELDAMLQTVVHVVRETVGGDSCSIFLYEPSSNTLTLSATIGLNQDAVGRMILALGTGITGTAALERTIIAVPDADTHPKYLDYPLIGDQAYRSQVSVPLALRSPDRLVGVLNILTLARREFDHDELEFLQTAADEISIAIENARLYSETDAELHRRVSQLSTLQQMSRLVASTLDIPELLRLISQQTVELTGSSAVDLYRLPRNRPEQLELLSRYPREASASLDQFDDGLRALVDEVIDTGTSIWRHLSGESEQIYVHALPMITGRRAVGALCVIFRERPAVPLESEGILHAFSDSAAIAIENAELYDEALRGYRRASTLLQEMHHRVRNNLQTVAALLSMQARRGSDEDWSGPLNQAVSRIQSIAAIHDLLSGRNLTETTVDSIGRYVVDEVSTTLVDPARPVEFVIEPSSVHVSSREATILALLINEFIANSINHGFEGREGGRIELRTRREGDFAVLEILDNGRGLPPDFDLETSKGLGLQIARTLSQVDLRGSMDIHNLPTGGTVVRLQFRIAGSEAQHHESGTSTASKPGSVRVEGR